MSADAVLGDVQSRPGGLTTDEAARRLVRYGANDVDSSVASSWLHRLTSTARSPRTSTC
ncbi:MAG: cation-transporting P-type ATPase [Candidatus Kapaibacterium sp.]